MGNTISRDSYLLTGPCSARNITWQYIHNSYLPSPYNICPDAFEILYSHCCEKGVCHPNYYLDQEFRRYSRSDWDGLGSPYPEGAEQHWGFGILSCWPLFFGGEAGHVVNVESTDWKLTITGGDDEMGILGEGKDAELRGEEMVEMGLGEGSETSRHSFREHLDQKDSKSSRLGESDSRDILVQDSFAEKLDPTNAKRLPRSWIRNTKRSLLQELLADDVTVLLYPRSPTRHSTHEETSNKDDTPKTDTSNTTPKPPSDEQFTEPTTFREVAVSISRSILSYIFGSVVIACICFPFMLWVWFRYYKHLTETLKDWEHRETFLREGNKIVLRREEETSVMRGEVECMREVVV